MIIHAFIVFCMVHNPTMCKELEIAPVDATLTQQMCLRGLMMGDQREFDMDGARWQIRGGKCRPVEAAVARIQERLKAAVEP